MDAATAAAAALPYNTNHQLAISRPPSRHDSCCYCGLFADE